MKTDARIISLLCLVFLRYDKFNPMTGNKNFLGHHYYLPSFKDHPSSCYVNYHF